MVDIPCATQIGNIGSGDIFLLPPDKLTGTTENHNFIVVAKREEEIIFVCCTSQSKKREIYFSKMGIPLISLVSIKATTENSLKKSKNTVVNCNDVFIYKEDELIQICNKHLLIYRGKIQEHELLQIKQGIISSKTVVQEIQDFIQTTID